MKLQIVIVLGLISFSACGKLKPLTAEQKAQLIETQEATGRVQLLVDERGAGADEKLTQLRSALDNSNACETRGTVITDKGGSCPAVVSHVVSGKDGKKTLKAAFTVKTDELKKLNDVHSFEIKIEGDKSKDGKSFEAEGEGKIKSLKHGDVEVEVDVDISTGKKGSNGKATLRYEFKDFEAEYKEEMDDGEAKYTLNNEAITKQEFYDFVNKGGPAFNIGNLD